MPIKQIVQLNSLNYNKLLPVEQHSTPHQTNSDFDRDTKFTIIENIGKNYPTPHQFLQSQKNIT